MIWPGPEGGLVNAKARAQLIVIPTANTRDEDLELFVWELRVPAAQTGVFLAMCNRVGSEHAMDFCGGSLVSSVRA